MHLWLSERHHGGTVCAPPLLLGNQVVLVSMLLPLMTSLSRALGVMVGLVCMLALQGPHDSND